MGKTVRRAFYLVTLFALVMSFQNCSPASFRNILAATGLKSVDTDNGSVFDGKPTFYQMLPDYKCEGQPSARSSIRFDGKLAFLSVNQNDHCGAVADQPIDPKEIDNSNFDADYVGYRDGIYERKAAQPDPTSPIYNEVLCQSTATDSPLLDVVIRYDELNKQAMSKIYYDKNGQAKNVPFFNVSRLLTSDKATYSASSFNLVIDRSQPSPQKWWYFLGTLNADLETGSWKGAVRCRMQAGKLLTTVQKLYSKNADWNSYVQRSDKAASIFQQPDSACAITTKNWADCVHGGDKLIIRTESKSCADLQIKDALKAFEWVCEDQPAGAIFFSSKLAAGHSLSDLVTLSGWKENFVQIIENNQVIYESIPMAWWKNSVLPLPPNPTGALVSLNKTGAVYVAENSSTSLGYSIDQNQISLVIKPGANLSAAATIADNCMTGIFMSAPNGYGAPTKCLVNVNGKSFVWIEGDFNTTGSNANTNFKLTNSNFLRFQNVKAQGSVGYGIYQSWLMASVFDNVFADNNQFGLVSHFSEGNLLNQASFQNNSYAGLVFSAWDNDNTLVGAKAINNGIYGFEFISTLNLKMISSRASNHPNSGISIEGFTDNAIFDSVFLSQNNFGMDINRSSGSNQFGNRYQNMAFVGNQTGLRVMKAVAVPQTADKETFANSLRIGNVTDCSVYGAGVTGAAVCPGSAVAGSELYSSASSLNIQNSCMLSPNGNSAVCAGKSWSEVCRLPDAGPLLSLQLSAAPVCSTGL